VKSKTNIDADSLVLSKKNDVIIPASGEAALDIATASCVLKEGVALGGDLNIIRAKLNGVFLSYYLNNAKKIDIARLAQGISVIHLYSRQLKLLKILFPKKEEQQKIANFFTAIDTKIKQLTKKKALLEAYKKGVMQQIFKQEIRFRDEEGKAFGEWEEKKIKDLLISSRLGGNYSNSTKKTEFPLIKMGNLGRGNIKLRKLEYIIDGEEVNEEDVLKFGDLLFNTRNTLDLVGKVAIWRNELELAYYNSNLMFIEFENNFFMNFRLNSFEGLKSLRRIATGTTSVAAIYTKDLLKVKLKLPCISEQKKISDFLISFDKKIEEANLQLSHLKAYKKGLLQKMFV